jgi:hypothetical protein
MLLGTLASGLFSREARSAVLPADQRSLEPGAIQHMVIFDLSCTKGSGEAKKFLQDGIEILTGIPVVRNFQAFKQVSPKNDYQYGFSMVFASREDYSTYNQHPHHVAFVQDRWNKEVTRFLEIDFENL